MKRKFLLASLIFFGILQHMNAQEFNRIPYDSSLKTLSNGWYKFKIEGASFDVELAGGRYVKGNIKWFDGSEYSGSLAGQNIQGKGTYKWPDGSRYEGAFKKHQRHGKGSFIKADGTKWSGKWKANAKNGKGTIFNSEGTVIQEGVWESDELVADKR
ncbi:hypothetical protein ACOKFD_03700 [Flagellimonas sp. S174]|uniref:hypothetical protein n=1 Tax=Flagellimonas sp. S174 TaxID=3410790 RepID=UPI003BF494CE